MSCCGNNTINNLNNIYNNNQNKVSGPVAPIKQFQYKSSPFNNYTTDYKPVLTANGKFVKYIRHIKDQSLSTNI